MNRLSTSNLGETHIGVIFVQCILKFALTDSLWVVFLLALYKRDLMPDRALDSSAFVLFTSISLTSSSVICFPPPFLFHCCNWDVHTVKGLFILFLTQISSCRSTVIQSKLAHLKHQCQHMVTESHSSCFTGTTSTLNLSSQNAQGNFQIVGWVTLFIKLLKQGQVIWSSFILCKLKTLEHMKVKEATLIYSLKNLTRNITHSSLSCSINPSFVL